MRLHPLPYWLLVIGGAALLLAGASAAATRAWDAEPAASASKAASRTPRTTSYSYKVSNNRSGRAAMVVQDLRPGEEGRRRMTLSNVGPRAFTRVTLTQDQVDTGGFSDALELQVYDAITRRCLYPRPAKSQQVPNVRVENDRCARWMPFDGGAKLQGLVIRGRDGSTRWRRYEQHAIDLRYRLRSDSPNADQGRRASFRLRWTTEG